MKKISFLLLLLLLAGGAFNGSLFSCQNNENPDAWEHYHNSYQPPAQVMDSLGVKPGMIIAEVGAGRGRYAVQMARRTGHSGKVYANDIDQEALDYLKFRCKRDSIQNVVIIKGSVTDPCLPKYEMDLVYMINTYHHLDKPVDLLKNLTSGLKPQGVLAIIEHDPEKVKDSGAHSTAKDVVIKQAGQAGFALEKILTFLSKDTIYIFKVKK